MRLVPRFAPVLLALLAFVLPASASALTATPGAAPACLAGAVVVDRPARTAPTAAELLEAVQRQCAGTEEIVRGTLQPRYGTLVAGARGLTYVRRDGAMTADSFGVVAQNAAGGVPIEVRVRFAELAPVCTLGASGWDNGAQNPLKAKGPRLLDVRCTDANGDPAAVEVVQQGKLGEVTTAGDLHYVPHDPVPTAPAVDTVKLRATGPHGAGDVRTLHLLVGAALNTPPQCEPVSVPQDALADAVLPHLAFCTDPDGDGITYEVKRGSGPHHGTVELEQTGEGRGSLSYAKDPSATAAFDTVRLVATDGFGGRADVLVGIGQDPGGACTVSQPVALDPGTTAAAQVACKGLWGSPMYVRAAEGQGPKAGRAEVDAAGTVTYRAGRRSGRFAVGVQWSTDPTFTTGVGTYRAVFHVLPGAARALGTAGGPLAPAQVPLPSAERGVADALRLSDMLTATPRARRRPASVAARGEVGGLTLTPDFDGTAAVAATLADGTEIGRGSARLHAGQGAVLHVRLTADGARRLRRARVRTDVRLRVTARDGAGRARTVRSRVTLAP